METATSIQLRRLFNADTISSRAEVTASRFQSHERGGRRRAPKVLAVISAAVAQASREDISKCHRVQSKTVRYVD